MAIRPRVCTGTKRCPVQPTFIYARPAAPTAAKAALGTVAGPLPAFRGRLRLWGRAHWLQRQAERPNPRLATRYWARHPRPPPLPITATPGLTGGFDLLLRRVVHQHPLGPASQDNLSQPLSRQSILCTPAGPVPWLAAASGNAQVDSDLATLGWGPPRYSVGRKRDARDGATTSATTVTHLRNDLQLRTT